MLYYICNVIINRYTAMKLRSYLLHLRIVFILFALPVLCALAAPVSVQVVASYGENTLISAKGFKSQTRIIVDADEEPVEGMVVNVVTEIPPAYK